QLTQRRARSVQRYLLTQGVDPQQLSQLAMGAVAGDDLAYCRRVELLLGAPSALPPSYNRKRAVEVAKISFPGRS
ncbi:MAG: hypothetical protein AAF497_07885, partial [Planctomycetota bacterium]